MVRKINMKTVAKQRKKSGKANVDFQSKGKKYGKK